MSNELERKQGLLAEELFRYFGETCPALAARWELALRGLRADKLCELRERLDQLDEVTNAANRQIRASLRPVLEKDASVETSLDQALASLERVQEMAATMIRHLDQISKHF